jgi:hypothetical protein
MLVALPAPVLSVAADAVRDLDGGEALPGLWTRESLVLLSEGGHQFFYALIESVYQVQRVSQGWPEARKYVLAIVVSRDDDIFRGPLRVHLRLQFREVVYRGR